jgi:hypothetical protein
VNNYLQKLEDPRNASGRRHGLMAVMSLMIATWGISLPKKAKESLGFLKKTPYAATLSNLLRKMDRNQ